MRAEGMQVRREIINMKMDFFFPFGLQMEVKGDNGSLILLSPVFSFVVVF